MAQVNIFREKKTISPGGQGQVVGGNVVGALIASGPVIIIAASFTNVAYERLPLDEEETLQMQPPVSHPSGSGGGGSGMSSQFPDPSLGLPFLNLPLNMPNGQLPMDGAWVENSAGRHNIRSKLSSEVEVIQSSRRRGINDIILLHIEVYHIVRSMLSSAGALATISHGEAYAIQSSSVVRHL
ncbi:AT-hook motif nuclear-localized protein 23 [Forsythia ovata]|uniref:AT-hook motif nuclear-localized protein 23 n=1 Tax=Forsythia ovata TaxID=205694 RepID=A0ABD1T6H7_9LAMI